MNKVKYTSGTLEKITFDYYTLVLYSGDKQVYTATLGRLDAAELIDKSNKVKLLNRKPITL